MNTLIIKVLNKFRILNLFNLNRAIYLNNKKFKIPILQKVGLSNLFMSEPWMIDLMKIVLPIEDGNFIDVGVNVGQTLLKLRSVSNKIDYIGFEPNPQCISYVNKLIKQNDISNTKIIPVGISNKNELGELKFFSQGETDSAASMIEDFRSTDSVFRKEYIPLLDLNTIKNTINIEEISILKIDVEGAELEVIKSFYDEIIKNKPIIFIEILPIEAYHKNHEIGISRQNEIQNLLKKSSYSIFRVIILNNVLIKLNEIEEIGIHTDLNACEYVMVPENKKDKFKNYCQQKLKQQ